MQASATPHSPPRVRFRLTGSPQDGESVRAEDFVAWVSGALECLRRIRRSSGELAHVGYRISDLSMGSALMEIEATSVADENRSANQVVEQFVHGLAATVDGTLDLLSLEEEVRKGFAALYAPFRGALDKVTVSFGERVVVMERGGAALIGPAERIGEISVGEYPGFVEALNVHAEPVFFLYPVSGPRRVRCVFEPGLLEDVKRAIKKYVTVYGAIEYAAYSPFPSRIVAERIDVHPDERELPKLRSLVGVAPDLTGGVESVSYLRALRDREG